MSGNKNLATALGGSVVAAIAVVPFVGVGDAAADSLTVINAFDDGAGSLRQAIDDANATVGPDTITFDSAVTGTIVLTTGQLRVDPGGLTITGPGAASLTISGNNNDRVFYLYGNGVDQNAVMISGLTIADGSSSGDGGNIYASDTDLTLQSVVVSNGYADNGDGGGIFLGGRQGLGSLQMSDSQLLNNTAYSDGGGLFSDGTEGGLVPTTAVATGEGVTIERSVISGNESLYGDGSGGHGGGVFIGRFNGAVQISETTIDNNTAYYDGGGIYLDRPSGPVTIDRSTISNNNADNDDGGGIWFGGGYDTLTLTNSTVSGNTANSSGGGIFIETGRFYVGRLSPAVSRAVYPDAATTIEHSTIDDNTASYGGNIFLSSNIRRLGGQAASGDLALNHAIVADGNATNSPDIYDGGYVTADFSLVEDVGFVPAAGANNLTGDPALGVLADNGGLTKTHLPAAASIVVNAGDPAIAGAPLTDQRGVGRIRGAAIDMGAVETTVAPVNDAYATPQRTTLNVPAAGVLTNDNGNTSVVIATQPTHGTVALAANGSFVYTPTGDFSGVDTFTYTASDGPAVSGVATVTITVTPVNRPPVGVDDAAVTTSGNPVTIPVLINDSDPDGDVISVVSVTQGSRGTAVIQGGQVVYTAAANQVGLDTFTYVLTDGKASVTVTVRVTINSSTSVPPVQELPATGGRTQLPLTSGFVLTISGAALLFATRRRNGLTAD